MWPWKGTQLMGALKSQEEFYLRLHAHLIGCDPLKASSLETVPSDKDLCTVRSRVQSEGLAFLTKTLPKLGKALDHGLVSGRFNLPLGFKRSHRSANIPAFMQAYFNLVFDEDGFILDVVPALAISHLRQVLYFAYKLEAPYSQSENSRVIENFIQTDSDLKIADDVVTDGIIHLASVITREIFVEFNHKDIHPQHGPGSVATGERGDMKWKFSRLYDQIHQVYPYYDYYVAGGARELSDRLDWYQSLQRLQGGVAKVVLVPKDSRGPRLISCEPLEYQWIQQGLGRKMAHFLEYGNPYTKGNVNFTDQGVNRKLAQTSSASQQFATLDLRDASDRVSLELVRRVFRNSPNLLRALEACRSTATKLPDGRVVTLQKYAPMGSALCFPVESYIFWVVIVAAVALRKNLPRDEVGKKVFVYGDDIIVPTAWALLSMQALEHVGLRVNVDKSCFMGFFRESCGMDAFQGVDVTPLRLRKPWPRQASDGTGLYAYTSLANKMEEKGYLRASSFIWESLELIYGKLPQGLPRSSFPCRVVGDWSCAVSYNKRRFRSRVNQKYQRIEFLVLSLSLRRRNSTLDGWPRMLRNFVSPVYGDPSRTVLPLSVKIKRGWATVT